MPDICNFYAQTLKFKQHLQNKPQK